MLIVTFQLSANFKMWRVIANVSGVAAKTNWSSEPAVLAVEIGLKKSTNRKAESPLDNTTSVRKGEVRPKFVMILALMFVRMTIKREMYIFQNVY